MPVSRTKRTLQNTKVSFVLFMLQVAMGFYSRRVFLEHLGAEVLGLNTTLGNILSVLNLTELGIGIAMATALYKPIHDGDEKAICEIISVEGILYKRVAFALCALGIPVACALPFVFPSTECGIAYVYIAYAVFLSGSVFGYLWNYRQVLVQADQKNYKLMPLIHGVRYAKILSQVTLLHAGCGMWSWIALEMAGNVATIIAVSHIIHTEYPWLKSSPLPKATLLAKYHVLIVKTKQLFVHKISSFVLEHTAPLIIYTYSSLAAVTYYANYMILIGYTVTLMNVVFEGMGASIGNLVAENNRKHITDVFWELFTSRVWLAGVVCYGFYLAVGPFVSVWVGPQYLLGRFTLLLLVAGMFIRITRSVIDSFKNAYQLFGDVLSPVVEACVNLGCSVLFGYWWGMDGVIMGSNLSLLAIVVVWKPYYTIRNGLHGRVATYYAQYLLHVSILLSCAFAANCAFRCLCQASFSDDLLKYVPCLLVTLLLYMVATYALLFLLTPAIRRFTRRIINIITSKP